MIDLSRSTSLLLISILATGLAYGQRELKLNDTVPDIELVMLNHEKAKIRLSELRGKAVIIDFWATWCAPCVASFPKLDSLQKVYKKDLQILSVTEENKLMVDKFLQKYTKVKKISPSTAVEDKTLHAFFPHTTVPHYVWINQQGVVKAITHPEEVTSSNINNFIKNGEANFALKSDPAPIRESPFQKMAEDPNVLYFHTLSKYIPGMYSGLGATKNMVIVGNSSLMWLYATAYGDGSLKFLGGWSKVKLITNDTLKFTHGPGKTQQFKSMWATNNTYNYVLKVPMEDSSTKYMTMRKNLEEYFPSISASVEQEERECFVLQRISNSRAFQAKDSLHFDQAKSPYNIKVKNGSMKLFVTLLQWAYQSNDLQVIDETGYAGLVDIDLQTTIAQPDQLNNALSQYGLSFTKVKRKVEILVIKDTTENKTAVSLLKTKIP